MIRQAANLPPGFQPAWLKRWVRRLIGLVYGDCDIQGLDRAPPSGAVIVAATHRSYLDPVVLSAFLPRTLYFMGKRELFDIPLLGALICRLGAFPVDRQAARGSTFRRALDILKLGGAVVIFPEGGIAASFHEDRFRSGVGSLASLSGAPVLPVVIEGSATVFGRPPAQPHKSRLAVRVGLIVPASGERGRKGRQAIAGLTLAALKAMTGELEHREMAGSGSPGEDNQEPTGVGPAGAAALGSGGGKG